MSTSVARYRAALLSWIRTQQEHLSKRQRLRVGNGDQRAAGPHRRVPCGRSTVKPQRGWTAAANDLDVAPQHAVRMPSSEGFHGGLLCGEAAGEVRSWIPASRRVSDFAFGKDATEKPVAETRNGGLDPIDLGGVQAEADDIHTS